MRRLALLAVLAVVFAPGCTDRASCVRGRSGWDVTVPVKLPPGHTLAACATRLVSEAHPPAGLANAASGKGSAGELAAVKLTLLTTLAVAREVPIVGAAAAEAMGRTAKVSESGRSFVAAELEEGVYFLDVACPDGYARARLRPPEVPEPLLLSPGANVTLHAPPGPAPGPWTFRLFKDESLAITREADASGAAELTGLPPGRWLVGAVSPSGVGALEVDLVAGKNLPLTLALLPAPEPKPEDAFAPRAPPPPTPDRHPAPPADPPPPRPTLPPAY